MAEKNIRYVHDMACGLKWLELNRGGEIEKVYLEDDLLGMGVSEKGILYDKAGMRLNTRLWISYDFKTDPGTLFIVGKRKRLEPCRVVRPIAYSDRHAYFLMKKPEIKFHGKVYPEKYFFGHIEEDYDAVGVFECSDETDIDQYLISKNVFDFFDEIDEHYFDGTPLEGCYLGVNHLRVRTGGGPGIQWRKQMFSQIRTFKGRRVYMDGRLANNVPPSERYHYARLTDSKSSDAAIIGRPRITKNGLYYRVVPDNTLALYPEQYNSSQRDSYFVPWSTFDKECLKVSHG